MNNILCSITIFAGKISHSQRDFQLALWSNRLVLIDYFELNSHDHDQTVFTHIFPAQ